MRWIVSWSILVLCFSVHAEEQQASRFVLCKNQKTVRTIRVVPAADRSSCTTTYTKSGKDTVVGQAKTMESCNSILKGIQENLEKSSWNCRSVGQARLTLSNDSVQ